MHRTSPRCDLYRWGGKPTASYLAGADTPHIKTLARPGRAGFSYPVGPLDDPPETCVTACGRTRRSALMRAASFSQVSTTVSGFREMVWMLIHQPFGEISMVEGPGRR